MSGEMSSQLFEYESIARVLFGPNARKQTGTEVRNLTEGNNALIITDVGGPSRISDIEEASKDDIPEMIHLYRTNPNITEFFEEWCKREMPTEAEATTLFEDMFEPEFRLP